MDRELIGIIAALVALVVALVGRRRRNGTKTEGEEAARQAHIATNLQLIAQEDIAMPANWERRVREIVADQLETVDWHNAARRDARHEIGNAVMVTGAAINAIEAPSDELDAYRRKAVQSVLAAFEQWKRS